MNDLRYFADGAEITGGPVDGLCLHTQVRAGELWITTDPLPPDAGPGGVDALARALSTLATEASGVGARAAHWETDEPEATVEAVATRAGLAEVREILQLRRTLPLPSSIVGPTLVAAVRGIRPGTADEEAWVTCNNRAFADHPDQGQKTVEDLHDAMAEPWFDRTDLLVLDGSPPVSLGGRLDGFCWTRVHPATDDEPARGEIYVIGVDPSVAGRGLGRALVVAGLEHLTGAGLAHALLYVDADNTRALGLYDVLGFSRHSTRWVRSRRA